jgi:hypothetical protein
MKKQSNVVDELALWASKKTQIKRLVIFNVTKELKPPPGRSPEIQIELLLRQQADPFLTVHWNNEIQKILVADITVLPSGQKIDLSKRPDYVSVYARTNKKSVAGKGRRRKRA